MEKKILCSVHIGMRTGAAKASCSASFGTINWPANRDSASYSH